MCVRIRCRHEATTGDVVLHPFARVWGRALGFDGTPVVLAVMIEALLLALVGGAVGGALAYLYCDGTSLSTLNFNTFSQVAFDFRVTPGLLLQGLWWSLSIGAVGGLLPAIQAARLPVTVALRTL